MRRTTAAAAVAAMALALGACGTGDDSQGGSSPSAAPGSASSAPADDALVVEITLGPDGPTPRGDRVDVEVGQVVRLMVDNASDEADEVHGHSAPEHSLELAPGATGQREFTVDRPGQVAVESHHADAVIVQLVVS